MNIDQAFKTLQLTAENSEAERFSAYEETRTRCIGR